MSTKFLPGLFSPLLLAIVLLGSVTNGAFGQSAATAVLTGMVTDPQGAIVPQASVIARNLDTGIESSTATTADGLYRFPNLAPGTYDVTVVKQGFSNATARGIHLNVGDYRDLDYKLQLAGAALSITVTTEAPLIETTRTDVSTVVDEKQMRDLPVTNGFAGGLGPSNDYAVLATMAPGVRYDFSTNTLDPVGPGAYNDRGNVYNVDGGNITDPIANGRDALGASLDEVKEFQVLTNNYNAEYGRSSM